MYKRTVYSLSVILAVFVYAGTDPVAVRKSAADQQLADYLTQFPSADVNGDGILTEQEHMAHLLRPILKKYGTNSVHRHVEIPLRDGHAVPAEVFMPATDGGPWPVLLTRAEYSRWKDWNVPPGAEKGVVYVAHDTREWDGGAHASWTDDECSLNEMQDGYDVVEWIAAQSWCNGRIGTAGGSGHGYASDMMFWADIPHYTVNGTENTAGNIKNYWCYHNGVRRGTSYDWIGVRGVSAHACQRPTLPNTPYNPEEWRGFMRERAPDIETWYFNKTGWFDPMSQGAIDSFEALQHTGKAFVTIEPRCHGGIKGLPAGLDNFPIHGENQTAPMPPSTLDILLGAEIPEGLRSTMTYFLMGDVLDPSAPGNQWMVTHEWPVPHENMPFYLHADGALSRDQPVREGAVSYDCDPRNPAPTIGGHHDWGTESGPWDQRPLHERDDVLYFVTEPLKEPFAITGNLSLQLYFSSDAKDTAFVLKVVDIYPDGYEFMVRESAGMARYHSGYEKPTALKKGRVYKLDLDLWSTAIVFNRGHRIGLIVTSSSEKSYEVHPNTFEPVKDYPGAPVARNTIHCAPGRCSVLMLPKVSLP